MTADNSARFAIPSKSFLNCVICNTGFAPRRSTQVTCSPKCSGKHKYQLNKKPKLSNCIHCGAEYQVKQGQSKYCSTQCRNKSISLKTIEDRKLYTEINKAHVRVSFCKVCHAFCEAPYAGNLKSYCSDKCERAVDRERKSTHTMFCIECRKFQVKTANGGWIRHTIFCSIECRTTNRAKVFEEVTALRRIAENNKPKPFVDPVLISEVASIKRIARNAKRNKKCLHCGEVVYSKYVFLHPTCRKEYESLKYNQYKQSDSFKQWRAEYKKSDAYKTNRKAQKAKRKALIRGATVAHAVSPDFILERDKYRCYICGIKTPKKLRGTYEDNAPEVDHIIPLSKGGLHVESNLRCSCRKCNGLKSDRIYQLI